MLNTSLTRIDQVVPGESAIIGDPRENRETIYGDHISMVKFSTKDDPGYKRVLNSIETLLDSARTHQLQTNKVCNIRALPTHCKVLIISKVKPDEVGREEVSLTTPLRWLKCSVVVSRPKRSTISLHLVSLILSDEKPYMLASKCCLTVPRIQHR